MWLQPGCCSHGLSEKKVLYGGPTPIFSEVRREFFKDGHVPLVAFDMVGMPREMISHMDAVRFYHLMKAGDHVSTVAYFLSNSEVKKVRMTCFLMHCTKFTD